MIALIGSVAVIVAIVSYGANALIANRAKHATADLVRIQARCAEIRRQTDTAQAQLDHRQWQEQLARTSNLWLSMISGVLDGLPQDVWVTRFETSPKDSTLLIDGRAANYDALSGFIATLHSNPAFSDIRLGSVRIVRIGDLTCLEFTVPVKLKLSSPSAPAKQANVPTSRRPGA